jgi:hypothetical protein
MATKVIQYKARNGRTYRISYDRSKVVTTAIEYVYDISIDDRSWTSYYGVSQAAASTRSGASLLATLGERGLRYICDTLDKGEEVPFRVTEQKDGSKYIRRL